MDITTIKDGLEGALTNTVLSFDSLYGVLIIVLIAWIIFKSAKRAVKAIVSVLSFILVIECGHFVAFSTELGTAIPLLQRIFKYDVLSALAQLCVGTKVSDWLLYARAYIEYGIGWLAEQITGFLTTAGSNGNV